MFLLLHHEYFCLSILHLFCCRSMAQNQPFALHFVLESNKLNETNYADWIRNLRIVLRAEKNEDVLDTPCPE